MTQLYLGAPSVIPCLRGELFPPPMKLLDRYILRQFLWNYAIALTVLIGMFVVMDMVFKFDSFVVTDDAASCRRRWPGDSAGPWPSCGTSATTTSTSRS